MGQLSKPCRNILNPERLFFLLGLKKKITEGIMGVVKHLFSCLYGQSDCLDVNHFRYENDDQEDVPHEVSHPYPAMGDGVKG